ncbi:MAG: ABC-F family ATP-binding cassette domain-containing protein [Anaerolineae bacterium]|nr:ABC-F family ATP-binding cassette domain-containing protein [Anaerolineae bacterium]
MSIVTANDLAKSYGAQDVFWDVSLRIARGDKIALVGHNGTGKTTLLHIIASLDTPTAGRVYRARSLRIGYLPQEAELPSQHTLYDEMLTVFTDLRAQQAELRRLEQQMANPAQREGALKRYGEALQAFELAGGYRYESKIKQVLAGLGFPEEEQHQPLSILSGGQKTRALLAKLLLSEPDLLLLDEPTNHLDLAATQWLEEYLANWTGSLVVVAHDRYFLDKVAGRVWELAFGRLEDYSGNYSHYLTLRAERMERRLAEYEAQQKHIEKTEDFIRRYMAGQRTREAQGRQKRLDRLPRLERPREAKKISLSIKTDLRGGDLVLVTEHLTIGYQPGAPLFTCPDLCLRRGERAALLGPNGSGKTTFLKTVIGEVPPLDGLVQIGQNVKFGYLAQAHEDLDKERTILDEILDIRNLPLQKARGFLGRFLFSGDDVFKLVGDLSGGERSRVALAKLTLEGANFLLLDEPTIHLDIASREILEEVLADFNGTILLVSHDRYLINALATQVWAIEDGGLRVYDGNYSDYVEQKRKTEGKEERKREKGKRRKREKRDVVVNRAAELEENIAALEAQLAALSEELVAASVAQDVESLRELGSEYQRVDEELHRLLAQWTEAGAA